MSFTSKTERRVIYSSGPHQHLIHTYIMAHILMGKKNIHQSVPYIRLQAPRGQGPCLLYGCVTLSPPMQSRVDTMSRRWMKGQMNKLGFWVHSIPCNDVTEMSYRIESKPALRLP